MFNIGIFSAHKLCFPTSGGSLESKTGRPWVHTLAGQCYWLKWGISCHCRLQLSGFVRRPVNKPSQDNPDLKSWVWGNAFVCTWWYHRFRKATWKRSLLQYLMLTLWNKSHNSTSDFCARFCTAKQAPSQGFFRKCNLVKPRDCITPLFFFGSRWISSTCN